MADLDATVRELRELMAAATAGEWLFRGDHIRVMVGEAASASIVECCSGERCEANARFIAAARNHLPALLDAVEAQRWIPVGERMPEPGVVVLTVHRRCGGIGSFRDVDRVVDGRWYGRRQGYEITHWQPLPSAGR